MELLDYSSEHFSRMLGISFETANSKRASACAVGLCVKEFATKRILEQERFLINPECEFSFYKVESHGITPDSVLFSPTFPSIYKRIVPLIDDDTIVVSHNASYNMAVLRHCCNRYNLPFPRLTYLDTTVLAKQIVKQLPSYSLEYTAEYLSLSNFEHHNPLDDATIVLYLFDRLMHLCSCDNLHQLHSSTGIFAGELFSDSHVFKPCSFYNRSHSSQFVNKKPEERVFDESFEGHPFYKKVIVFTGALKSMQRKDAKERAEIVGGIVKNSITSQTNFLVCGSQSAYTIKTQGTSSKFKKAEQLVSSGCNLEIINEYDFFKLL